MPENPHQPRPLSRAPIGEPATRRRAIIFNADDFGLTAGVNAGVIEAHRAGLVGSASLMVTTPAFDGALELARAHPALDLGIHLALTGVPPALAHDAASGLVAGDRFHSLGVLLARLASGRVSAPALRAELRAQLERALASGLTFTHLDSHHHVHLLPHISTVVGELARECGIACVRRVPALEAGTPCRPAQVLKRLMLRGADWRAQPALRGLRHADAFRGVPFPANLAGWRRLLRGVPTGTTEFMCHPGRHDPAVAAFDSLVAGRAVELAWLRQPALAALLRAHGITPASFVDLDCPA